MRGRYTNFPYVTIFFLILAILIAIQQFLIFGVFFDPNQILHHELFMVICIVIAITIFVVINYSVKRIQTTRETQDSS